MCSCTLIDDFALEPLEPLDALARLALLEILEDRHARASTLMVSQLPVSSWHEVIGEPTIADAICGPHRARRPPHRPGGRFGAQAVCRACQPGPRYVTVRTGIGFDERTTTAALSRAPQGTSSPGCSTAGRKTAGPERNAGRMRYAPCSTSRMAIERGSTICPTIFRSPRSHTSWRRFAGLILPNWTASSRHAGSGATEGPADRRLRRY